MKNFINLFLEDGEAFVRSDKIDWIEKTTGAYGGKEILVCVGDRIFTARNEFTSLLESVMEATSDAD